MNMQAIMRQAQKMQKDLEKTQKELEATEYEGSSSFVKVKINGNKDIISVKIDMEESIEKDTPGRRQVFADCQHAERSRKNNTEYSKQ